MSRKFKRESADYAKHCRNRTVMRLTKKGRGQEADGRREEKLEQHSRRYKG